MAKARPRKARPKLARQSRRDTVEHYKKQDAFLDVFESIPLVRAAAAQVGVARSTVYRWLKEDPEFRARYEEVDDAATQRLEQEALRRGVVGVEKPVFGQKYTSKGQKETTVVGTIREYSDTLLIFMLKARRPEKYRDNVRVSGEVAHAHAHAVGTFDLTQLTDAQYEQFKRLFPAAV